MNIQDLTAKINYRYRAESGKILAAYEFARLRHEGQKRATGEPYIVHPMGVADVLLDLGLDADTVCAAFLHDVLEDTQTKAEELAKEFGKDVADLVLGVTKYKGMVFESREEEHAENFRKMFFAMANDVRVLLIKLADRLHNMRTISAKSEERRVATAKETLEIYAPLASRLGLSYIKCEMEDLCLKVLHPTVFQYIKEELSATKDERQALVETLCKELRAVLSELKIKGEVSGRPKHMYSIYRKMLNQKKAFSQIYDITAVRVIVKTVDDCYALLGKIHNHTDKGWKPIPGRFKDYIAVPKPNNYKSLHTTVVTDLKVPFEIQIRTAEMHKIAEYGIAAHWVYKEKRAVNEFDKTLGWLRSKIDTQNEDVFNSADFMESLKTDLRGEQVFVFSPKGDVITLPLGSTPVDFAYSIHSDIGNKCVSAKIDNKMVPLTTKLVTGNSVEIITANNSKGPSRDWLKFVVSSSAKSKIRAFLKKAMREDNIKIGREMLEAEAKRRGFTLSQLFLAKWLDPMLEKLSVPSVEELYSAVGYGGVTTGQVLLRLIEQYQNEQAQIAKASPKFGKSKFKESGYGIVIKGYDDLMIKPARCCTPVPGDAIIGFVSRGRGITVHRAGCSNIKGLEKERLIEAEWSQNAQSFVAKLQIIAVDSTGILARVMAVLAELHVSAVSVSARVAKNKDAVIEIGLVVASLSDVDKIVKKLESLSDVKSARRVNA